MLAAGQRDELPQALFDALYLNPRTFATLWPPELTPTRAKAADARAAPLLPLSRAAGLLNCGSTCYVNATLTCMAALPVVMELGRYHVEHCALDLPFERWGAGTALPCMQCVEYRTLVEMLRPGAPGVRHIVTPSDLLDSRALMGFTDKDLTALEFPPYTQADAAGYHDRVDEFKDSFSRARARFLGYMEYPVRVARGARHMQEHLLGGFPARSVVADDAAAVQARLVAGGLVGLEHPGPAQAAVLTLLQASARAQSGASRTMVAAGSLPYLCPFRFNMAQAGRCMRLAAAGGGHEACTTCKPSENITEETKVILAFPQRPAPALGAAAPAPAPAAPPLTIAGMLQTFFAAGDVAEEYTCPARGKNPGASKNEDQRHTSPGIATPPLVFHVQLGRFARKADSIKITTGVHIDLEVDLKPYLSPFAAGLLEGGDALLYEAAGFKVHRGKALVRGHYVAYTREGGGQGTWTSHNDEAVTPGIPFADIPAGDRLGAYEVFYVPTAASVATLAKLLQAMPAHAPASQPGPPPPPLPPLPLGGMEGVLQLAASHTRAAVRPAPPPCPPLPIPSRPLPMPSAPWPGR